MKPTNPTLDALLASRQFFSIDLYRFILADGTVLRFCAGDVDITVGGHTYSAGGQTGPYFNLAEDSGRAHWGIGTGADTMQFQVAPGQATLYGLPWSTSARYGVFDGAEVERLKAIMPTYGDVSAGTVLMFAGRVGDIDIGNALTFQVNSWMEVLTIGMPRNLFQPGCVNSLFDPSCGLTAAVYAVPGTIGAGSTAGLLLVSGPINPTGWFDQGKVVMTSGVAAGFTRAVKYWIQGVPPLGTLAVFPPLPVAPTAGDTFTAYPGCDKTASTCASKFGNISRHRGFPQIPTAETAL
jgi:uncharacterized phage protein (TIGR02218 family)